MIPKQTVQKVLQAALDAGADFAELYYENTERNSLQYRDGKVETMLSGLDAGAGLRVFSGTNSAYAYTCDISAQALMNAALSAAQALKANAKEHCKDFVIAPPRPIQQAVLRPREVDAARRVKVAQQAYQAARDVSAEIVQTQVAVFDVLSRVLVANSNGVWAEDERARARLAVSTVASANGEIQTGFEGPGTGKGFEFFSALDIDGTAQQAAQTALTMLHAPYAPAGKMTVAVGGGFGGVIFHEACGHSLEATAVAKGNSEFAGRLGEKIASEKVTAVDDGTLQSAWGSIGYDDEGHPSQRNVLIENGILKGYLIDHMGSRRMGMPSTGSGRRQNYRFAPTSRMTNTFIADGNDENVIASMVSGLYAKKMGGGSVNPLTGEFNFAVQEGYLVKNGQIDKPVRGATLIGKGSEVLQKIDAVEKGMWMGEGMCGSVSGSVPTCVGEPLIRVSEILVGGREV